jgi:hypothetical protein
MPELLAQPSVGLDAQLFPGALGVGDEATPTQPEYQLAMESPVEPVGRYVPRHSAEKVSLRERLNRSGIGRTAFRLAVIAGLVGGPVVANVTPAMASGQEYTITDDASGGVYARNSPHTNDTERINGKGIYPGDIVRLICGVTNGDPVGEIHHNTTWHKIINESRPDQGQFWENDHYFNTPNKPGELAPGEKDCNEVPSGEQTSEKSQPIIQPCYYNMKAPNTNLTFSYDGTDGGRYYGNAWQAAKDWTNLGAGITITPGSDRAYIKFKDMYSTEDSRKFYGNADVSDIPEWTGPLYSPPMRPHVPSSITIEVNQRWMDTLDNDHRTYVLEHEIGHALGLAHTDRCGVSDKSIMKSGGEDVPKRTVLTPQEYDKIALAELYNFRSYERA